MKGRIYNACKTREPDTRYNATYKGLHRSLSTDDQLGAYVYKMIERVKDGRTNKNGETGVGKFTRLYLYFVQNFSPFPKNNHFRREMTLSFS